MNSSTHKFWASSFVVQIVQFNLWHTHYKLQMRQSQWWCRSVRFDADYFTYYLSIITTRTRQMRVETVITLSKIGILDTFSGRSLWKKMEKYTHFYNRVIPNFWVSTLWELLGNVQGSVLRFCTDSALVTQLRCKPSQGNMNIPYRSIWHSF